jgi:hypothetical protein
MSTLSRNCNSDAIEKTCQTVAQLKQEQADKSTTRFEEVARIKADSIWQNLEAVP